MSNPHKNKWSFKSIPKNWEPMARCWSENNNLEKERKRLLVYLKKPIKINLISACKERHIRFNSVFYEDWNLRLILDMLIEQEYLRYAEGKMSFEAAMSNFYSRLDTPLKQVCRDFLSLNLGSGTSKTEGFLGQIDDIINNDKDLSDLVESNRKELPELINIFPLEDFKGMDSKDFEIVHFSDDDRVQLDNYVEDLISQKFDGKNCKEMKGLLIKGHSVNQYYKFSDDRKGYDRLSKRRNRFLKTLIPEVVKLAKSQKIPWIFVKRYLECLGAKEKDMPRDY